MSRFYIPNEGHVVNIIPPIDINGTGASSDVFSMEGYSHVDIILQLGVTGAASTVTVEECDNLTPTTDTAIAFTYYTETTAAGDTLSTKASATTAGFSTSTNDNVMYVISIDASQLSDGYPCLQLELSDPSAATVVSAVAILSGARYGSEASATAIA
jgi:hypothetical protein